MDGDPNWTEYLIQAVQKRPFLYDKSLPGYADKEEKHKAWTEVCEEVIENWRTLSREERALKEYEVQQRWKNLRTCFTRELREQKKGTVGYSGRKRRKYVYYEQLLFLLPTVEDRTATDDLQQASPSAQQQDILDSEDWKAEIRTEEDSMDIPSPVCLYSNTAATRRKKRTLSHENSGRNFIRNNKSEETDEDKLFLLSLLPAMKRLREEYKYDAKIDLLKVMSRFHKASCGLNPPASTLPVCSVCQSTDISETTVRVRDNKRDCF